MPRGVIGGSFGIVGSSTIYQPPVASSCAAMWWADDLLAIGDGNPVDSWMDRIGGKTVSSTGSNRPLLDIDGLSGKPSLTFDGVDDYLEYAGAVSTATAGAVIAVWLPTVPVPTYKTLWSAASITANNQWLLGRLGHTVGNQVGIQSRMGSGVDSVNQVDETILNTPTTLSTEWESNGTLWSMMINNTLKPITIRTTGTFQNRWFSSLSSQDSFCIGSDHFRSSNTIYRVAHAQVHLGFIAIYDVPLTSGERTELYNWINSTYGV